MRTARHPTVMDWDLRTPFEKFSAAEHHLKERASSKSVSSPESNSGKQFSVIGVMAYLAMWAMSLSVYRHHYVMQQGTHSLAQAQFSQVLVLIATGLLFVAIGLPIIIVAGFRRQAVPISVGCFCLGVLAIPIFIGILLFLALLGIIDID